VKRSAKAGKAPAMKTLRLQLNREDMKLLTVVVGWMLYDPELADSRERLTYSNALLYSLRRCVAHPPQHVESAGG